MNMEKDHVDGIQAQWNKEIPSLDTTSMGIVGRFSRISRYIDQSLHLNHVKYGLNGGEFDVLASLYRSGKPYHLTPTKLFKTLMLSSGAMTNRLDKLENAELILRKPNPDDRRGTFVALTNEGLLLIKEAYISHINHENIITDFLSDEEKNVLINLLRETLIHFEHTEK